MKSVFLSVAVLSSCFASAAPYEENWDSLSKHTAAPEWLADAKLGIYFHWGVYSVPAYRSEWYPFLMCQPGSDVYKYHQEKYGHPSKFGYHDFVPQFTAEHFDPEEWAQLFQESGARFAGPVAEHHDGFSMWDSEVTPWNAKDMGPKRDILGELFTSLRKRDLKTIATFHHARQLQRYKEIPEPLKGEKFPRKHRFSSHYVNFTGWPTASDDPKLQYFYGNMPEDKWLENVWYGKLKEVIDQYQPDIMWFDSWMDRVPEDYRKKFSAYYLNEAQKWNRDVVIIRKQQDLPLSFSINDHEKSREPKAAEKLWMTDDTISTGSWCYTSSLKIKPLSSVVHALADTVSKNGVVLLNLSPKADGTIPDDQRKVLKGLGNWLKANGEAIYATRPWIEFGEGPTKEPSGGFKNHHKFNKLKYSAADIRYTQSKDGKTVYAIMLGIPKAGSDIKLASFSEKDAVVDTVTLVSNGDKLSHKMTADGLQFQMPQVGDEKVATAFKIQLK